MPAEDKKVEGSRSMGKNTKEILGTGGVAAALAGISFITEPERVFGANDRVRVGVCGIRGQGFTHVEEYSRIPNVEVAAVCDVDETIMSRPARGHGPHEPSRFPRPIATYTNSWKTPPLTPFHRHAQSLARLDRNLGNLQAGKDVYIEKPCCHYLWEGNNWFGLRRSTTGSSNMGPTTARRAP